MTVGKRCAGLDLRQPDDRSTFSSLLADADVLVHGYRANALDGLGFGSAERRSLNPQLISVGLNAFGWSGPWRNRRGFDSLVQRSTGLAVDINGEVVALPYQVLDHSTGYLAAAAVVQAVRARLAGLAVESAKLSLARQAQLLIDVQATSDVVPRSSPPIDPTKLNTIDLAENSPWGRVRRYRPPFEMAGLRYGWAKPATRLRSATPSFSSSG